MINKCKCMQCEHVCEESEVLIAQNPFDITDMVSGCPQCKSVDSLVTACDAEGCTRVATSGWPSPKGYRHTCGEHYEK